MTPRDWISRGLGNWRRVAGRAPRAEFWWLAAALVGGWVLLILAAQLLRPLAGLIPFYLLAALVPLTAAAIRRLHDTGRAGAWLLIPLFAGLGWAAIVSMTLASVLAVRQDPLDDGNAAMLASAVFLAILTVLVFWLAKPSDPGDNAYGPNPHEVTP